MKIAFVVSVVLLGIGAGVVAGSQGFPKASPARTVTTPARTVTIKAAVPKPKPKPHAKIGLQPSDAEIAKRVAEVQAQNPPCHPLTDKESEEEGNHNREAVEKGEPEPCPPTAPHRTLEELQAHQEAEDENRRLQAREEECLATMGVASC